MPLGDALKALASGLGASNAAITRHHHRTEDHPRLVALFSGQGPAVLSRAYCRDVLGNHFDHALAGTAWFLSEMYEDPFWTVSHDLDLWLHSKGAEDIAVIPMSVSRQCVDYIEFHFPSRLTDAGRKQFQSIVPTIERSWLGRKPGLVAGATLDGRAIPARISNDNARPRWDQAILGMSNPAGLSRAEFRVCLLLSRGLSVKAVSEELGLSDNTVRSHLRAIYSKTETASLPELIYLIMSVTDDEDSVSVTAYRA